MIMKEGNKIKIRLLLIEDSRLLRDGIVEKLEGHNDINIVGASGDPEDIILRIHKMKPTVILLDHGLRNQDSLHVAEIVKKEFPAAKVIVINLAPVHGDILQFVHAGASGFILRDATLHDFLTTIRAVAEGEKVLPPILNASLFSQIIEHAAAADNGNATKTVHMTKREEEVVGLMSEGLSNKEIGQRLHVATYTVKSHVHNIMEKLALHTRLQVANSVYTDDSPRASRSLAR